MMTRKILSLAILGVIILALGTQAAAQERLGRWERLQDYLALTETQVGQMRDLLKKHHEAALPLRQQLRDNREALRAALAAAEPSAEAVGKLVIARQGLRAEARDLRKRLHADFVAILTPEQKAKFEDLKKLRPGRRQRV